MGICSQYSKCNRMLSGVYSYSWCDRYLCYKINDRELILYQWKLGGIHYDPGAY